MDLPQEADSELDEAEFDGMPRLEPGWPVTEADKAYVRAAIEEALAEAKRGETISSERFEAELAIWRKQRHARR